jgi:hypothetical protein
MTMRLWLRARLVALVCCLLISGAARGADSPGVADEAFIVQVLVPGYEKELVELRQSVTRERSHVDSAQLLTLLDEADRCTAMTRDLSRQPRSGEKSWRLMVCLGYIRGVIAGVRETLGDESAAATPAEFKTNVPQPQLD